MKYTDEQVCEMTRQSQPDFLKYGPFRVRYNNKTVVDAQGNRHTSTPEAYILDIRTAKVMAVFPSPQGEQHCACDGMNMGWLIREQENGNSISDDIELKAPYVRAAMGYVMS